MPPTTTEEQRRDRGIGRLSKATRAIGAAIAALVAALAVYVGEAFPGHQPAASSRSHPAPGAELSPAASAPTSSRALPPVTSAPS